MACDLNFSMEGESLSSEEGSDVTIVGLNFWGLLHFWTELEKTVYVLNFPTAVPEVDTWTVCCDVVATWSSSCRASVTSASTVQESAAVSAVRPDFLDL